MSSPRGIEERIDWFLGHNPSDRGMCAQHTWQSLGGDYGNPAAWSCDDANECVDKVKASGRFWTPSTWSGPPPKGAWLGYKYGSNGHACLSLGDGRIATTDPGNGAMVGIEDLDYPNKWGASGWDVWTDQYNGVRFEVGDGVDEGDVYLSKLIYGQEDSDSVSRLQVALNGHKLEGGSNLPITGNYFDQTDHEVRLCQQQHGFGDDPVGASSVGPSQADHLFAGTGNNVINDLPDIVPPEPPDPPDPESPEPEPEGTIEGYGTWDWYSGKKSGPVTISPSAGWVDLPGLKQPASGKKEGNPRDHHFIYTRWELPSNRSADRVGEVRWVRDDGDATAYDYRYMGLKKNSYGWGSYHTEAGSGIGGKWQARVTGGTDPVKITTNYAKTEIEWQEQMELVSTETLSPKRDWTPTVMLAIAIIILALSILSLFVD
jgi:hypothetical protein